MLMHTLLENSCGMVAGYVGQRLLTCPVHVHMSADLQAHESWCVVWAAVSHSDSPG